MKTVRFLFINILLVSALGWSVIHSSGMAGDSIYPSLELSLFQAMAYDDENEIAQLLKAGANPNKKAFANASLPLEMAEKYSVVKLLLEHGASPTSKDRYGDTPLHHAIFKKDANKIIEFYIENGADVNAKGTLGRTALHRAVTLYIETKEKEKMLNIIKLLVRAGADINSQDEDGYTVLISAVVNERVKLVELLLQLRARVDIEDNSGMSALEHSKKNGFDEIIKILTIKKL